MGVGAGMGGRHAREGRARAETIMPRACRPALISSARGTSSRASQADHCNVALTVMVRVCSPEKSEAGLSMMPSKMRVSGPDSWFSR